MRCLRWVRLPAVADLVAVAADIGQLHASLSD